MYRADSDILSIIIAIITLVAGAVASMGKKKREKEDGQQEQQVQQERRSAVEDMFTDDDEDDDSDPFTVILRSIENARREAEAKKAAEEAAAVEAATESAAVADGAEPYEMAGAEQIEGEAVANLEPVSEVAESHEPVYGKSYEEGARSTVGGPELVVDESDKSKEAENLEREKQKTSLKERLKSSPKELIIFSEVMKPKFKEY